MTTRYIELHARSAFSFLRGASVPEELIAICADLKMPAMALLDCDGVYGAPRFHMAATKNNIKAHIGAEVTLKLDRDAQTKRPDAAIVSLPLLVQSRAGYQNLCRLITRMKLRTAKHPKPGKEPSATLDELAEFSEGLLCLLQLLFKIFQADLFILSICFLNFFVDSFDLFL